MAFVDEFITFLGFEVDTKPAEAVQRIMEQIGNTGKKLALGLTGAAAGIGYFADATARSLAVQKDFTDSIGASFADLQDYQHALIKMGGSADEASGDLEKLQMMAKMKGVSVKDVVLDLAEKVKGQGALGTKFLMEKFGMSESGIRLLRVGADKAGEAMDKLEKTSGRVTDSAAENSQEYVRAWNSLSNVIRINFNNAIGEVLPEVTNLIGQLKDWIASNKEIIKSTLQNFIKGFTEGFRAAISVLKGVVSAISPLINIFGSLTGKMTDASLIATATKYSVLALATILAGKFLMGTYSAIKGVVSFTRDLYTTIAGMTGLKASLLSGITTMKHYALMTIKHPVMSAKLFANALLSGIAALWRWTVTLVTQSIPAMIKFSLVMMKNAIKSIASFVVSIVTVGIPALISFAATFFATVIPAVWAFTAALLANPVTWIVIGIVAAVAALVAAVIGLYKWFTTLLGATGSISESFKIIGQTILKVLLQPINLVVDAIVSMLTLLSKIPVVGKKFKGVADSIKEFQDKANSAITGTTDKYDVTSPTMNAVAKSVYSSGSASVSPNRPAGGGGAVNNAKLEQTININGAANPNEVGRQIVDRTSTGLHTISPGMAVPMGSF